MKTAASETGGSRNNLLAGLRSAAANAPCVDSGLANCQRYQIYRRSLLGAATSSLSFGAELWFRSAQIRDEALQPSSGPVPDFC